MALNRAPYMPRVDERPENALMPIFAGARQDAEKRTDDNSRQVILVTLGRLLMHIPCPRPGSMARDTVAGIERIAPPNPPQRVSVIAFTELESIGTDVSTVAQVIPFLGYVLGLGYLGHNVIVFEGHESALRSGCQGAHLLIVDGGMLPHMHSTWADDAYAVMESSAQIIIFGRDGKLTRISPTNAATSGASGSSDELFQRAMALMKQENWTAVITTLTEAIAADPEQFDSYFYRGVAYEKQRDFQRAIPDYGEAIRLKPDQAEIYAQRGGAYREMGDLKAAVADYNTALKMMPENAIFYRGRAAVYAQGKAFDRMLKDYTTVIKLNTKDPRPWTDRGLALQDMGDHERAIADFTKSLQLDPQHFFAYTFRAESYAATEDYKAAVADMEKYVRSGLPRQMGKQREAEARLQELKQLAKKNRGGLFGRL